MEQIKLGIEECAIVLRKNGKIEYYVPHGNEELVPPAIQFFTSVAILIKREDKEFCDLVLDKWNKMLKEQEKENGK